ncbi:MAG: hypothetical protein M3O70_10960, partial [Actinomycetota bacterium]|nr:hypothetical protein [Actinomycetota bacterium]
VVLTGFYRYCVDEQLLEHSPAVHVRHPKVPQESTRIGLDRNELGAWHAAIAAALDAGCSLRDVQDYARHADPRQTRRYDRARGALDRNPTYIVATYVAGATGAR